MLFLYWHRFWKEVDLWIARRFVASAASGLVRLRRADEHALAFNAQALSPIGRRAALHAHCVQLGNVFGHRQKLRHRFERLAARVLVEAGDDDARAAIREHLADPNQAAAQKLGFINAY